MGGTLGTLWVKSGHPVLFSSRHPEELKKLVDSLGPLARVGTVREALTFGEVVFIAVPYAAYPQLGKDYAQEFKGKIVIDAGNAVPARDGEISKEARENGIGMPGISALIKAPCTGETEPTALKIGCQSFCLTIALVTVVGGGTIFLPAETMVKI